MAELIMGWSRTACRIGEFKRSSVHSWLWNSLKEGASRGELVTSVLLDCAV